MCGITGIVNFTGNNAIEEMTNILSHRGPDDSGTYVSEEYRVSLGHRRLSIIDLSSLAHQPMSNKDKTVWITYNGEIYNYKEIGSLLRAHGYWFKSNSDTEVIVHAYEEWGIECLEKLNGMFAFAIWDERSQTLWAARDRLGIKPFYYARTNGSLIFASEIKAVLASGLIDAEVDWEAVHNPWSFQVSPRTGFKNIFKLPPGHWLKFKDGSLTTHKYWDIKPKEDLIEEKEAVRRLAELLEDSVRLQMISDVPVGAFLSGGLDSSAIVAFMSQLTDYPVHTFTIRFSDQDQKFEAMPDDSRYARQVAGHFGCRHQEIEISPDIETLLPRLVWHLDEPLADPAAINTYLISQASREAGVVVLLNGMGGDEIFGGYRKQLACLLAETYQKWMPALGRKAIEKLIFQLPVASKRRGFRNIRWVQRFLSFASLPQPERYLASDLSISREDCKELFVHSEEFPYEKLPSVQAQKQYFKQNGLSYLTQICQCDSKMFLPEHNLTYSDRATMAAGVESRPPLVDHRIVEFMFSLAPEFRIKGVTQKYLLKKAMEGTLPKNIIYRPKAPFGSPLRSWIRGPLSEMVDDLLNPSILKKRGLYRSDVVWKKIKADREGKEDNAHLIWTILTTELWFRTFFHQ